MDILDKLGIKKKEAEPKNSELVVAGDAVAEAARREAKEKSDLMGAAANSAEGEAADDKTKAAAQNTPANDDPHADWSKEQVVEALKEARNEAAKRRVEAKDLEQRLQEEHDAKLEQLTEKFEPLLSKAKKLDKLENEEADKKRNLEEKISHRDTLVAQRDDELSTLREEIEAAKIENEKVIGQLKANLEAHESYYTDQLEKEKAEIPKKYQALVETMVKGADDSKHALDLIRGAKKENLFGEKKVFVNHSVPGASTGARTDSAKAQNEKREGMKSSEKIREGLKTAIPQMAENKRNFGL